MSLVKEELDLHVLCTIKEFKRHYAYGVGKSLANRPNPVITSQATILIVFARLEQDGLIEIVSATDVVGTNPESKRVRKYYSLTERGEHHLGEKTKNALDLIARLTESISRGTGDQKDRGVI
jgi:DNA-binding PadR family transcriptional regulator